MIEQKVILCGSDSGKKWHIQRNDYYTYCGGGVRKIQGKPQSLPTDTAFICKNCLREFNKKA